MLDAGAVCMALRFADLCSVEVGFAKVPKAHNAKADRAIAGAS